MKSNSRQTGFTIIELLVVVSIIGLLLSLLIPAVGKARDSALTTQSLANLRNMSAACGSYGADWSDRQVTFIYDDFGQHITSVSNASEGQYKTATGSCPPSMILGYGGYIGKCGNGGPDGIWGFWTTCEAQSVGSSSNVAYSLPMILAASWTADAGVEGTGAWRMPNVRNFSQYINSKFYDKVFYAPKDKYSMERVQPALEQGKDFSLICEDPDGWVQSTYCFSPAAMFGPDAYGSKKGCVSFSGTGLPPSIFRSPSVGQAAFPDLKTRMLEHQWLQNKEGPDFNPKFAGDIPYFFNHCVNSAPATLFFDGHVSLSGCNDSMSANAQLRDSNQASGSTIKEKGLFASDTISNLPGPWGNYGGYFTGADGKQGADFNYDTQVNTSFHVFTTDGILGRDFLTAK
ncbi:MAG: prepilin-type N-terminal cleavage/methylation domain-containing protein [Planctomycetes bacterium]|nr:prepilin-type N-terminal cleavage/methylation domain-containing protein [Planctomycetota bacterium]